MSFFGENEIGSIGNICVEAAEGYSGTIGAQMLMVEGFQNDMDMFSASLMADRQEHRMVQEGASESEVSAMQEGALSSFWEKVKAFVRKLIAKIKGIFKGFIAKFEAWMGKDGRAFFDKYKKEIFSGKDLDGLKVKYSKPTSGFANIKVNVDGASPDGNLSDDKSQSDLVDEYLSDIVVPKVNNASKGSFRKDFHDECFDSEEATHEVSSSNIAEYVQYISGKKDPVSTLKKLGEDQEKGLNNYLKQIEKFAGKATDYAVDSTKDVTHGGYSNKFSGKDTDKTDGGKFSGKAENHQKLAARLQKQAQAMQEALGVANSAVLTEIKFAVAQSRRIAAAIVAFNPKKHEDTSLIEVEQEAAEYEVLSALEAVY